MAITVTQPAAERIRHFMSQRKDAVGLRFGVKTTGCSGLAYIVDLTDKVATTDHVYESNGVKVIVDKQSLPFIDGTCIDFTRDAFNEGFRYLNPNVKSECGCGESFGV